MELHDRKVCYLSGDLDGWLEFWRKPRPKDFPPPEGVPLSVVHFFQAQCWSKLNDHDTASLFMKAAEKRDPQLAGLVLHELNLARNDVDARKYANRVLNDQRSNPVFAFMAASILLGHARSQTKSQLDSLCHRLVPALSSALEKEKKTPMALRELPDTEDNLIGLLGMCLEIVGKHQKALALYNQALKERPRDPDLLLRHGIVLLYFHKNPVAYDDFSSAIQFGSKRCLPYLLLAQREFNACRYWEAYDFAKKASEKVGTRELLSLAHQVIAMSLSMRGQDIDWVLDNFKLAEKIDPDNPTIAINRSIAIARVDKKEAAGGWRIEQPQMIDFLERRPISPNDPARNVEESVMAGIAA
jgi:tetratricopeptide (TPR) repeat protein